MAGRRTTAVLALLTCLTWVAWLLVIPHERAARALADADSLSSLLALVDRLEHRLRATSQQVAEVTTDVANLEAQMLRHTHLLGQLASKADGVSTEGSEVSPCRTDAQITARSTPPTNCTLLAGARANQALAAAAAAARFAFDPGPQKTSTEDLEAIAVRTRRVVAPYQGSDRLSTSVCRALLTSADSVFHFVWGGFEKKLPPRCVPNGSRYVRWVGLLASGAACQRNWYSGAPRCEPHESAPHFSVPSAPALLGYPISVSRLCNKELNCSKERRLPVSAACVRAGFNVQATAPDRCAAVRDLEWLLCALLGALPQQGGARIAFASATTALPLQPIIEDSASFQFGAKTVYALHVCLIAELCRNGDRLFNPSARKSGFEFECDFDSARLGPVLERLFPRQGVPAGERREAGLREVVASHRRRRRHSGGAG